MEVSVSTNLIELLEGDDMPPPWLVPDLICQGTMVVLAGEAGAGKSYFSYTLGLALAAGLPFLTRPTVHSKVLYFDEENSLPDLRQYLRWAWNGLGRPSVVSIAQNFIHEHFSLAAAGRNWDDYLTMAAMKHQPRLIVLDTTTPACHVTDENDNAEATDAIRRLRRAQTVAPGCTLLLLKHARLNEMEGVWQMRGAKAWKGSTDATLVHQVGRGRPRKDGLRNTVIRPDKVRAFGLRVPIHLHPEWVGEGSTKGIVLAGKELITETTLGGKERTTSSE